MYPPSAKKCTLIPLSQMRATDRSGLVTSAICHVVLRLCPSSVTKCMFFCPSFFIGLPFALLYVCPRRDPSDSFVGIHGVVLELMTFSEAPESMSVFKHFHSTWCPLTASASASLLSRKERFLSVVAQLPSCVPSLLLLLLLSGVLVSPPNAVLCLPDSVLCRFSHVEQVAVRELPVEGFYPNVSCSVVCLFLLFCLDLVCLRLSFCLRFRVNHVWWKFAARALATNVLLFYG